MTARVTAAITIDRSSAVPLYHQMAAQLQAAIAEGRLQPGDALENELDLAHRLSLSRPTVRQAIQELVRQGLLIRRRGVGTTVANRVVHRRAELTSLFDDLIREHRSPTTAVLGRSEVTDAAAATALGLPADTPLLRLERVRSADGVALAVMQNWIPLDVLGTSPLTTDALERIGLYTVLRDRGVRPALARQSIGARMATARERALLDLRGSTPVLTMTRSAYASDGAPVEYGSHAYRADQYTIDVLVHER